MSFARTFHSHSQQDLEHSIPKPVVEIRALSVCGKREEEEMRGFFACLGKWEKETSRAACGVRGAVEATLAQASSGCAGVQLRVQSARVCLSSGFGRPCDVARWAD